MNTLTRWEPMRELQTMRRFMDRFMDEPFFDAPQLWSQGGENFPLPLDVIEQEGEYIVKASMPGVEPDQVEITLTDNVLTIKGESKRESDDNQSNYHVRERHYGSFMRQISLPMGVDADKVEATHENGVLILHLPKSEASKPKKISVKKTVDSNSQSQINAHNGQTSGQTQS
ncbi:MAG: Hsp20/alpha crystallin family protein [Caldilineaceae bacterium]|nr:Hsp20/alpha crystallin family protein [Caldilineaceae bacterium]